MFISNQWTTSDLVQLANKDIQNLNTLNSYGIKGIVDVSGVFFDLQNNTLRSDWEARWNSYWSIMYPHLSKIAAFYPMDEPDGNLPSMTDYAKTTHIIKINLDSVDYPIAILLIVTPSGVIRIRDGTLAIPPEVSWLGFDEYGCWDSGCFQGISIPNKFQIIVNKAKQTPGRKVVVVPGAVAPGQTVPSPEVQQQMVLFINNYYQLCKNEPLCVGMFPFLWQTIPNVQGGLIGADSMTVVENRLKQIGLELKPSPTQPPTSTPTPAPTKTPTPTPTRTPTPAKTPTPTPIRTPTLTPTPTPLPKPGDLNGDGHVDIYDVNLLVTNFGNPYTIYDINAVVSNFGK